MRAAALSVVASAGLLAACGGGGGEGVTGPPPDEPPEAGGGPAVASIAVMPEENILIVGQTVQLVAETRAEDGTVLAGRPVSWTTSDPDVAEVDPATGLVLAAGPGEATITATSEGVEGNAAIGVIAFRQVSAGFEPVRGHTCAVTTSGAGYCWGRNDRGQLGDGTTTDRTRPVLVALGSLEAVASGERHTCALTSAGRVYCWGDNGSGQLGDGTTTDRSVPTPVPGLDFTSLTAGALHTCGITQDGTAYCWGLNVAGQLGTGSPSTTLPVAVAPPAGETTRLSFTALSAGRSHTCGITDGAAAYCWGANVSGQLGDGTTVNRSVPVAVAPPAGQSTPLAFTSLSVGLAQTCGLTEDGVSYCWGRNASGQLGDGTTIGRPIPGPVQAPVVFTAVEVGGGHACALAAPGRAYCWGVNGSGELGDGTTTHRLTPVEVAPPANRSLPVFFASLDAGDGHTCGATIDGRAYCWGSNFHGQLGTGTMESSLVPVAVVSP